ncbi:MAG: MBL fold metallo-hydrolase [Thermoleophilaceae bacterium]|nr:MBL fold metallo-hydrolase [Thermoleophilaceae bacterium]
MRERTPPGVRLVRADNPSPLTLAGTNTWLAAGWAIDPGPDDPEHLGGVLAAGPVEGVVLTHSHADHAEGAEPLARLAGGVQVLRPAADGPAGPFEAIATPGHSADHVCLLLGNVCFSGDTVLGTGSVFISPGEGSLGAYLDSLRRLRELDLDAICPGHGPVVWDPRVKLDEYIAHRLEREERLLAALAEGLRDPDGLLAHAWSETPPDLRFPAMLTMQAHLAKLAEEGRVPEDLDLGALGVPEQHGAGSGGSGA